MNSLLLIITGGISCLAFYFIQFLKKGGNKGFCSGGCSYWPYVPGGMFLGFMFLFISASMADPFPLSFWFYITDIADNFERYRLLLCDLSLPMQSLIGLLFVLLISCLSLAVFVVNTPVSWRYYAAMMFFAWCGIYVFLPFHLSAPDLDDVFVANKFLETVQSHWESDKPFFTIYDYLYRIADLFFSDTRQSPFLRYSINGWIYVLFQLNFAVILWRGLGESAIRSLGRGWAVLALFMAMLYLGAVVLSHGIHYELAGATLYLLSFNVIESLRASLKNGEKTESLLWLWCGFLLFVQFYSTKQLSLMWIVSFVHAALALAEAGRLRRSLPQLIVLTSCSLFLFILGNHNNFHALANSQSSFQFYLFFAFGAFLGIKSAWLFYRSGRMACWLKERNAENTAWVIYALYFFAGFILFVVPNKLIPGIPLPLLGEKWNFATNYARYSLPFYPFFVLAAGLLAFNIKPRISSLMIIICTAILCIVSFQSGVLIGLLLVLLKATPRRRLLFFMFSFLLINHSFVTAFYFSPPGSKGTLTTSTSFQKNMRPILAAGEANTAGSLIYYLPLRRDYADHYIMLAARPDSSINNICDVEQPAPDARLLLSRQTLNYIRKEAGAKKRISHFYPLIPSSPPCRSLDDKNWEIQLLPVQSLDQSDLKLWCDAYKRPVVSQPDKVLSLYSQLMGVQSVKPQLEQMSEEWVLPAGSEAKIKEIFYIDDNEHSFRVDGISINKDSLQITVKNQRGSIETGIEIKHARNGETSENSCPELEGLFCAFKKTDKESSFIAADYIRWIKSKHTGSDAFEALWIKISSPTVPETQALKSATNEPAAPETAAEPVIAVKMNELYVLNVIWLLVLMVAYGYKAVLAARGGAGAIRVTGFSFVSFWGLLMLLVMLVFD